MAGTATAPSPPTGTVDATGAAVDPAQIPFLALGCVLLERLDEIVELHRYQVHLQRVECGEVDGCMEAPPLPRGMSPSLAVPRIGPVLGPSATDGMNSSLEGLMALQGSSGQGRCFSNKARAASFTDLAPRGDGTTESEDASQNKGQWWKRMRSASMSTGRTKWMSPDPLFGSEVASPAPPNSPMVPKSSGALTSGSSVNAQAMLAAAIANSIKSTQPPAAIAHSMNATSTQSTAVPTSSAVELNKSFSSHVANEVTNNKTQEASGNRVVAPRAGGIPRKKNKANVAKTASKHPTNKRAPNISDGSLKEVPPTLFTIQDNDDDDQGDGPPAKDTPDGGPRAKDAPDAPAGVESSVTTSRTTTHSSFVPPKIRASRGTQQGGTPSMVSSGRFSQQLENTPRIRKTATMIDCAMNNYGEDWPAGMPKRLLWVFAVLFLTDARALKGRPRRLYFLWKLLCCMTLLSGASFSIFSGIDCIRRSEDVFPIEFVWVILGTLVLPIWHCFIKQYAVGGPTRVLLHEVARRKLDWKQLCRSLRNFFILFLVITGAFATVESYRLSNQQHVCLKFHKIAIEAIPEWDISPPAFCTGFVVFYWTGFAVFGAILVLLGFLVRFTCALHVHEMMWYAGAVSSALQQDLSILPALHEATILVSGRFLQASETWVKHLCVGLAGTCMMVVLVSTMMLSDAGKQVGDPLTAVHLVIATVFGILLAGLPLAEVAEVFDFDVLRGLNSPVLLWHAQRVFGQQFLAHLHTLDWGFRVGQTTIDMKMIIQVFSVLTFAGLTTVAQLILAKVSSPVQ